MAVGTQDVGVSLLQFALVEYVPALLISVVAVRAGEVGHVGFMGEDDRGALPFLEGFVMIEHDLLRLSLEDRSGDDYKKTDKKPYELPLLHISLPFKSRLFRR